MKLPKFDKLFDGNAALNSNSTTPPGLCVGNTPMQETFTHFYTCLGGNVKAVKKWDFQNLAMNNVAQQTKVLSTWTLIQHVSRFPNQRKKPI